MTKRGSHMHQAPRVRNARILKNLIACLFIFLAFALGFFIRGNETLLSSFGFTSLIASQEQNPGATVSSSTDDSMAARLTEVQGILETDSLDSYDLEDSTNNTLDGFFSSTEDKYLRYYDEARYKDFVKENTGQYAGIGALFSEYNGHAYVVDVFEGSAAQAAGVEEGDFVVAIDGDRGQDWSMIEAVNSLARDEGDSVVVIWRRPSSLEAEGGEEFTTTMSCSEYSAVNVETEMVDKVGYISIKQLTQNSASLVDQAVQDLENQGAQSFVLDLRDNPGGYLTQAVDLASLFVKSGVIVEIQTREGQSTKSATGKTVTDRPLVVLVNEDTSAAAEVVVAALQDSQRATLVGSATMGKGSVQVIKELSFGGALRYTAAYYKTPAGHAIQGTGIVPDITVVADDDLSVDSQKKLALETAQSFISS